MSVPITHSTKDASAPDKATVYLPMVDTRRYTSSTEASGERDQKWALQIERQGAVLIGEGELSDSAEDDSSCRAKTSHCSCSERHQKHLPVAHTTMMHRLTTIDLALPASSIAQHLHSSVIVEVTISINVRAVQRLYPSQATRSPL
jgi:hypothetical protein